MHPPLQNPKYASDVNMPSQTKWRNVGWKNRFIFNVYKRFLKFLSRFFTFFNVFYFFRNVFYIYGLLRAGCMNAQLTIWLANGRLTLTA